MEIFSEGDGDVLLVWIVVEEETSGVSGEGDDGPGEGVVVDEIAVPSPRYAREESAAAEDGAWVFAGDVKGLVNELCGMVITTGNENDEEETGVELEWDEVEVVESAWPFTAEEAAPLEVLGVTAEVEVAGPRDVVGSGDVFGTGEVVDSAEAVQVDSHVGVKGVIVRIPSSWLVEALPTSEEPRDPSEEPAILSGTADRAIGPAEQVHASPSNAAKWARSILRISDWCLRSLDQSE
ncbi:hypothetical protein N7462_007325 [Penicillium macrosclerotiorum]|uniref:uncharacterized protein n=1 Tax=Penicillium macrosclerotiorum TaxID=303699 RepID=UPI002549B1AA|nr:uncharacterized protein N7462_007325 [Penicillium macrosclerotiorum]KAJ5679081.1 hypothetical protein N7462_007325 [Penicillium macrosclerotiorum]